MRGASMPTKRSAWAGAHDELSRECSRGLSERWREPFMNDTRNPGGRPPPSAWICIETGTSVKTKTLRSSAPEPA